MTVDVIHGDCIKGGVSSMSVMALQGGLWSCSKPLRDTSWWHRRKRERACNVHEWHSENSMGIDWFCCKCGKETDVSGVGHG